MIINCSKHGRTRRDTARLAAHLYKSENDFVLLAEVGNTAAVNLAGALRDMELLRDGAIPGAAAFHHFPLSPATNRTHAEIVEAAHALRREFDPGGTRPYAVVIHGKERAGGADGRVHGHLVLGNFSNGRAIRDRFSKLRTERLAREIEYSWRLASPGGPAEPCGLGRHHVSVLRALRKCRPEVATWLVEAHGEQPEQPKSAISSASRNRAKRLDFDLPAARASVQRMWTETLDISSFKTALSSAGYEIAPGAKAGVWVLRDSKNGFVLGALDRLLRLKRHAVRNMMMETIDERKQRENQPGLGAVDNRSRTKAVRPIEGDLGPIEGADAASRIARTGYPGRGSRPDPSDYAISGSSGRSLAAPGRLVAGHRWKTGILTCKFQHQRTLILLRRVGRRLAESGPIAEFTNKDAAPPQRFETRWDIWGVPIEPPKYRP